MKYLIQKQITNMTKEITGLYFGSDRRQAKIEIVKQIFQLPYVESAEFVKLKKIKGKDLYEYKAIVIIA